VKKIGKSQAFKKAGASFFSEPLPPCSHLPTDSSNMHEQFKTIAFTNN